MERAAKSASGDADLRYLDLARVCDQPVLVCTGNRIVFANDAATGLLGATRDELLIGCELVRFFPDGLGIGGADRAARPDYAPVAVKRLDGSAVTVTLVWMPCR